MGLEYFRSDSVNELLTDNLTGRSLYFFNATRLLLVVSEISAFEISQKCEFAASKFRTASELPVQRKLVALPFSVRATRICPSTFALGSWIHYVTQPSHASVAGTVRTRLTYCRC